MRPSAYSTSASPESACASHSASPAARACSSAAVCAALEARASPRANSKEPRRYAARDDSRRRPAPAAIGSVSRENGESRLRRAGCAMRRRHAEVRVAPLRLAGRVRERALERGQRARRIADVAREVAFEEREGVAHFAGGRDARSHGAQERLAASKRSAAASLLAAARYAAGARGSSARSRCFGMQGRVALRVPVGRAKMQRAPVAVQERGVRAVANERVHESESARVGVVGAHEIAAQQHARVVGRVVEKMPQHGKFEALADDSGRLHRRLVRRRQAVETAQHDALDGRRESPSRRHRCAGAA